VRIIYVILLLLFLAAVGVFAWQNQANVPLQFINQVGEYPLAAVIGVTYLLGMLTGWTVVGLFKRSLRRVTEEPRQHHHQHQHQ